eukprot:TRINITY_DN1250_c0_g1_i1.p1 TRINITY_DN1250_c0_g1~~TRINITY_DN1250_c0_g1_i1.p1  ORF type:complete len:130 (-),score=6.85 TRINITY_DN1250_c0_g1_i1:87-434(-)
MENDILCVGGPVRIVKRILASTAACGDASVLGANPRDVVVVKHARLIVLVFAFVRAAGDQCRRLGLAWRDLVDNPLVFGRSLLCLLLSLHSFLFFFCPQEAYRKICLFDDGKKKM